MGRALQIDFNTENCIRQTSPVYWKLSTHRRQVSGEFVWINGYHRMCTVDARLHIASRDRPETTLMQDSAWLFYFLFAKDVRFAPLLHLSFNSMKIVYIRKPPALMLVQLVPRASPVRVTDPGGQSSQGQYFLFQVFKLSKMTTLYRHI